MKNASGVKKQEPDDEPDDLKGILKNDEELADTRRRCLIKQKSQFYMIWCYVQSFFFWFSIVMVPFLSATNCTIMVSDRFTRYLYFIFIFNLFDIFFGMTSEKVIN